MTIRIERMTIIGVGLLGASLGLALKKRGMARCITGVGRNQASLDVALEQGAIDNAVLDAHDGVVNAEVVAIATPATQVVPMLDATLAAAPDAVVFDVASVKRNICAHARAQCPEPRRFVGCHPMAGGEQFGPSHGAPDFFEGAVCLVEQDETIDAAARDTVCALWQTVGARVAAIDADVHDAVLAHTSHLPHLAAAILARLAADCGAAADYVGNAFRDVTRIAASRPELWRDICLENREALAPALNGCRQYLTTVQELLEAGDADGLQAFFEAGARARQGILES